MCGAVCPSLQNKWNAARLAQSRMEWIMQKMLLAVAVVAVVAAAFAPSEASARHRGRSHVGGAAGWSAADFCGGRLPAWGVDACGTPEFSYGPGSCWRRAVVRTPDGPVARRVRVCGRTEAM